MLSETLCSYCLKPREKVGLLVRSPLAAICRDCAQRALTLIDEQPASAAHPPLPSLLQEMSNEEILDRLPEVADAQVQVEEHLTEWVSVARKRKISWDRIGKSLGMTRQSAWERFKHKI